MANVVSIDRERSSDVSQSDDLVSRPVLRAEGLSKQYGPVTVLFEVTLDILPGEIHAIIGENGAGKSTFMRLLSGYAEPTAGTVSLAGEEVKFLKPEQAQKSRNCACTSGDPACRRAYRRRKSVPWSRAYAPWTGRRPNNASSCCRKTFRTGMPRLAQRFGA